MKRVSVVGNSGSGKTTLAAEIAGAIGTPHLELDAVFHQPGWTELPVEAFRATVGDVVATDRWVVDGNYTAVQDLVWARADTVVWLDFSRLRVMRQIVGRTLRRLVTRKRLWNGNREPWCNLLTTDPKRSIIAWAWTHHSSYRDRYGAAAERHPDLTFIRLQGPADVKALLGSLRAANRTES